MLTVEDAFRATPNVNEFPPEVVKAIAPLAVVERHSAGSVIFREGMVHDQFAIVISGLVALEMHIPIRGDLRILTVGRGDILGWSPLLGAEAMSATAKAVDDVVLLAANGVELRQLCERDHNVGYSLFSMLAKALSSRLFATRLQLLDVFSNEPPPIKPEPAGINETTAGRGRR